MFYSAVRHRKRKTKMESFFAKSVRIASVVTAYWIVSISMVFLNKYLLSNKELKLDAPVFITWFQCVVAVGLCAIFGTMSSFMPKKITFPHFQISLDLCKECLPLSVVFAGMITFNNLSLKYLGVSFYFVGRSLTTVFNVVFTYFILHTTTSGKALGCCALIISGFLLGVSKEGETGGLSYMGVFFGISASAFVALNAIFTKKILPKVDNDIWKLTLYNNINAVVLFLPIMVILGEVNVLREFTHFSEVNFWVVMTITGCFGFGIGFLTGLQIKVTSPLTHNISGTAKACAQTVIATAYFEEVKTGLWWLSNFVVLLGSGLYTEVKRREMKATHEKALATLPVQSDEEEKPKSISNV